ncbi:MAG: DUF3109 family protein [Ignavibacteriales bacterium]|nr:MAG: DUF3109 family protein [Ignavibacteriales bacterium]
MYLQNSLEIEGIMVREEILDSPFSCDLNKCKGACCTLESQFGAPITEEEIKIIENNLTEILNYIPVEHKQEIERKGFWENKDEELMIRSLNNRDCVFSFRENGIAKCGIEKGYFDNKIDFRKPISCHLFPIRISRFGGDVLRYEKFNECAPAIENGKKMNTTVAEFCKDSLMRHYGETWYEKLSAFFRS